MAIWTSTPIVIYILTLQNQRGGHAAARFNIPLFSAPKTPSFNTIIIRLQCHDIQVPNNRETIFFLQPG